jgi:hypothetical protein
MEKFDFKKFSNDELLKMEQQVDSKLSKVLVEMRYNDQLENLFDELEAIKEEKSHRDLDG